MDDDRQQNSHKAKKKSIGCSRNGYIKRGKSRFGNQTHLLQQVVEHHQTNPSIETGMNGSSCREPLRVPGEIAHFEAGFIG